MEFDGVRPRGLVGNGLTLLPYPKIFTLSLSPSSVQGKKEILGYGNTGHGESMGRKRKTNNSCFHFRFDYYK